MPSTNPPAIRNWTFDAARDKKIQERAHALLLSDPELAPLWSSEDSTKKYQAFRKALAKAAKEFPTSRPNPIEGAAQAKPLAKPLSRDDAIHALALKLLGEDPELRRLNERDEYKAFHAALRKASKAGEAALSFTPDGPAAAALSRAKRVHKVAMIHLTTMPFLIERAARNYPEAFESAHRAAESDTTLNIEPRTELTSFKRGSREEGIHRKALKLLTEPWLCERDRYDSDGAFDEAIREASVSRVEILDPVRPNEMRLTTADDPLPLW